MATKLERMEDDLKEAAEIAIDEALDPMLNRLDQAIEGLGSVKDLAERVAKIEHWLATLGDLAKLGERLAQVEKVVTSHSLDLESNSLNVDALVEEVELVKKALPQGVAP